MFVVRPFRPTPDIDFRAVHERLIAPALAQTGYLGGTTEDIAESGIIPESMFLELVQADLVVADVSVHNANVFYELGIRHALRPSATILLRARRSADPDATPRAEIPFDIHGVRYVDYDARNPAADVMDLVTAIRETAAARAVDSPVYRFLPDLRVDAERIETVPGDLAEQIAVYRQRGSTGDLRLLAEDVVGLRFEERALRLVAAAQAAVGDRKGARDSWEQVRARRPGDYEANQQLATLFARLEQPELSDQAIDRALGSRSVSRYQSAELHALRGSNLKDRWRREWCVPEDDRERARAALRSATLDDVIAAYTGGFRASLDNYYAGLNALTLTAIQLVLIAEHPDVWRTNHPDDAAAERALGQRERLRDRLAAAVRASLDNAVSEGPDPWLLGSEADFAFACSEDTERIHAAYQRAARGLSRSTHASLVRQLRFCHDVGFRRELATSILTGLGDYTTERTVSEHVVVFTGHMIDQAGGGRFPPEKETAVKAAIAERLHALFVERVMRTPGLAVIGFAPASEGGDILFHEACRSRGFATEVFLPVPDRLYRAEAVGMSASGTTWLRRYSEVLHRATPQGVHTLAPSVGLPSWVDLRRDASTWTRTNRWILHHAWARSDDVTVLALWDGRPSEGPGGVSDMVARAQRSGANVEIIDITALGCSADGGS